MKKSDTTKTETTALAVTNETNLHNVCDIKAIPHIQPKGFYTCNACGDKVASTYATTTPKNALDSTPKQLCEYCYCTSPSSIIRAIDHPIYNAFRSRYNLARKS